MEPLTLAASRRSVAAGTSSQTSTTPSSAPGSARAELPAPRRRGCFLARCRALRSMPAPSPAELRPRQRLGTECGTARHGSARLGSARAPPPHPARARRAGTYLRAPKARSPGRAGGGLPAPRPGTLRRHGAAAGGSAPPAHAAAGSVGRWRGCAAPRATALPVQADGPGLVGSSCRRCPGAAVPASTCLPRARLSPAGRCKRPNPACATVPQRLLLPRQGPRVSARLHTGQDQRQGTAV